MNIKYLQQKYKLSQEEHDNLYKEIKKKIIGNRQPGRKICNIIIGQNGSGKSTYSKILQDEDDSLVIINGDYIRSFHPYVNELMSLYPKDYCYILLDDWNMWKDRLYQDIISEGYSVNFETTFYDPTKTISLIDLLKSNGYTFNFYIIALDYIESRLRVLERFFNSFGQTGTGRIIDADYQNKAFNNITNFIGNFDLLGVEFITILDYNFIPYNIWCGSGQSKLILNLIRKMYKPMINENFIIRFENLKSLYQMYENLLEDNIKQRCSEQMKELDEYLSIDSINVEPHRRMQII